MRESTREIKFNQVVVQTKNADKEDLIVINEDKQDRRIKVTVGYFDSSDNLLEKEDVVLTGEYYDLLMTDSPSFAPGKPLNEYREIDLWHVIDLMKQSMI